MRKFKVGDKVRVLRLIASDLREKKWVNEIGIIIKEEPNDYTGELPLCIYHDQWNEKIWVAENEIELIPDREPAAGSRDLTGISDGPSLVVSENETKRTFETGATRDTAQGKLDYVKALSPIVLKRYVEYLNKHRKLPDGSFREFDNWKQGIPQEVYHSSKGRHFVDEWLITEGYQAEDNHGPVELEDAICAQLFNAMGRLREILKARGYCTPVDRTKPVEGGY